MGLVGPEGIKAGITTMPPAPGGIERADSTITS